MAAFNWGTEALTFGSLMMFASGLVARSPNSVSASPIFWSSERYSGKLAMMRPGERDVPGFDRDASMLRERLDDGQKGIGREGRRFVGLCVDDGRKLGHVCWLKLTQRLRVLTGHGQKQLP